MFKSLMHVSFFAENLDEITDFYVNKLGAKIKMLIRNRAYADKPNHSFYKRAIENPDGICIVYFQIEKQLILSFKVFNQNVLDIVVPSCVCIIDSYQFKVMFAAYCLFRLVAMFNNLIIKVFLSVKFNC